MLLEQGPSCDVEEDGDSRRRSPISTSSWWRKSSTKIYMCHIFSSWGDRMWGFAVSLFMVILYPDSLLLTGIYGFSNCLSGIILGPCIGGWIDKTQRITAARCSVLVQNISVVVGVTVLSLTLHFQEGIKGLWNGAVEYFLFTVIIIIAIIAELASVANKIALEKDWIVVLAGGDNKQLARLNSNMRTINLTTYILAPSVVGLILHYCSPEALAIFIASWNIISAFIEYNLLLQIYKIVPQLGKVEECFEIPFLKINSPATPQNNSTPMLEECNNNNDLVENEQLLSSGRNFSACKKLFLSPTSNFEDVSLVTPESLQKKRLVSGDGTVSLDEDRDEKKRGDNNGLFVACGGWRKYFKHHVLFAGLGLASLYMTVLGFDIITIAFVRGQGVHEGFIGILNAIGAFIGIMGSLSFPFMRHKLGKNITGMIGFSLEAFSLILCVVSVFIVGSPFRPSELFQHYFFTSSSESSYATHPTFTVQELWDKERHVIVLLLGIILARFGLWIADLSVTQIFQEGVEESQRGVINGVQDSLNKLMDLIKFALVILLPSPDTFGYLIFLSWFFIFLGTLSFFNFVRIDKKKQALPRKDDEFSTPSTNA